MSAAAQKTFQSARRQRGTNNSCCSNQIIMVGAASSILLCLLLLHRQSGSQASSPAAAVVAGSSSGLTLSLAGQREVGLLASVRRLVNHNHPASRHTHHTPGTCPVLCSLSPFFCAGYSRHRGRVAVACSTRQPASKRHSVGLPRLFPQCN